MDPVHGAVLALAAAAPFGQVMDVGSGRGQLGVVLLEAGLASQVLALDQDADALAQLDRAAADLPLRTRRSDLAAGALEETADTVLLIDVLYQLATEPQLDLVRRAAEAARRTVIIRTTNPARAWRTALSKTLERLGRNWWPTFGARYNALAPELLTKVLAGCGFHASWAPCAAGTPLSGVLIVARRQTVHAELGKAAPSPARHGWDPSASERCATADKN